MALHTLASGETPTEGMRVFTYDYTWGTIVSLEEKGTCGIYCEAWHDVRIDETGGVKMYNCTRLTTREPRRGW